MAAVEVASFQPATDLLIGNLRETLGQIAEHEHPEQGGDLFCLNLTSYLGGRMGPVLRRLADEQAETQSWKDRHTALADEFAADVESLNDDLSAVRTERDALAARVAAFKPVAFPSGEQLYAHRCSNVEWWHAETQGPINEQGCDACESGPDPDGWRPVYVQAAA